MKELFSVLFNDENICLHVLTFLDMCSICSVHRVNKQLHHLLESTVGDRCIYGLRVYQIACKITSYSSEFKEQRVMMNEISFLNRFDWGHKVLHQKELNFQSKSSITNSSTIFRRFYKDRNNFTLFKEILKEFYFFPFHRIGFKSEAYTSYKVKHEELFIERWRPCKLIEQVLALVGDSIQDVIVEFQHYLMMYTKSHWSVSNTDVKKLSVTLELYESNRTASIEVHDISDSTLLFHFLDKFSALKKMHDAEKASHIFIYRGNVKPSSIIAQYDMKTPTKCDDIFVKALSSVQVTATVGGFKKQIEKHMKIELSEMREELLGCDACQVYEWEDGASAYNARQQVFVICPNRCDALMFMYYEKHITY
ncbi:hypothetical protein C9374_000903 [Naegleria lovaniensis]|uniref:F-box domain-containing protein n=1 Tax=Naegleria lovaniensis TaxID=51637 RepID=A0AA88GX84_NAELO|nr:uncharacterized protein C9374_000903 [Naegleria lovaniensis]KAG2388053.1 hypothetical protein C9374_000903 [Naegleria lovaniensis]